MISYYLAGAIVTAVRTVIFTTGTNEIHLFNPVFMEKFIPHVNEYARSVIDLVTIYVSLKIPLKSGKVPL